MSNPIAPEPLPAAESNESFEDILSQYEKTHSRKKEDGGKQLEGTVIAVSAESVFFDIGFKSEGIIPLAAFQGARVKPGDKMLVSVKGRDPEGYYELSRQKIAQPTDWSSLEQAFAERQRSSVRLLASSRAASASMLECAPSCPPRAAAYATLPKWRN